MQRNSLIYLFKNVHAERHYHSVIELLPIQESKIVKNNLRKLFSEKKDISDDSKITVRDINKILKALISNG